MTVYKIEYFIKNEQFGWTDTRCDNVLAKNEKTALEKFDKKHPDIQTRMIVNYITIDY